MPLDGLFMSSLVKELRDNLLNSKVDKINQPEKDEVVLTLRGENTTFKLLISSSASFPKMHLTDIAKPNPLKAPMFCMVLRKHITNARLIDINQVSTDRIVKLDFEGLDEFGYHSIFSLIIEVMGRHSNATLIRERDNMVLDSIKHVTPDISQYRCLYPGIKYVSPPPSEKLDPFDFSLENYESFMLENSIKLNGGLYSKVFTGVSMPFSRDIDMRLKEREITFDQAFASASYPIIKRIFDDIKYGKYSFILYGDETSIKDFYCTELYTLKDFEYKRYASPSKLLQDFYFEKDKAERLFSKSSDLQKVVNTNIDRCEKKMAIMTETLGDSADKEKHRLYGELLTANIYSFKKGDKSVRVLNYYSKDEEYIDIPLDENKTPSDIIQNHYKKYTKMKKSEEMSLKQMTLANEEMDYLQSVLSSIKNAESYQEIEEVRRELMETGYIKLKKLEKKKMAISKPSHYISSDGIDIYVGKNNSQNDYLTLKFADKHDLWLHTKKIPGSHVIIKKFGEIPETTLLEAANLAAYYSKAKESSKVEVDFTEVRNIKKPTGAKPGMVIYYTNKTLNVNPEKPTLKKG